MKKFIINDKPNNKIVIYIDYYEHLKKPYKVKVMGNGIILLSANCPNEATALQYTGKLKQIIEPNKDKLLNSKYWLFRTNPLKYLITHQN